MGISLRDYLSDVTFGEPLSCDRLRIYPLSFRSRAAFDYEVVNEMAASGLLTVEETSAAGSVPNLVVRNHSPRPVLLPDGLMLVGSKQNRVVNLSVMLGPESTTTIPVSCVEQGRWHFVSAGSTPAGFTDSRLRAKMCRRVSDSLSESAAVRMDQGEVWDHVEGALAGSSIQSSTRDYHAVYEDRAASPLKSADEIAPPPEACGVAVEIDGVLEAIDLFDKAETLHKLWPRLFQSYQLAAAAMPPSCQERSGARDCLERVLSSQGETFLTVGVGSTMRFAAQGAVGAGLVCDEALIHLSVFRAPTEGATPTRGRRRSTQS